MHFHWILFRFSSAYYLLYALAFVAVLLATWGGAITAVSVKNLPMRAYNTYQCATQAGWLEGQGLNKGESINVFRIMDLFHGAASKVADALCQDLAFGEYFERVEVTWVNRNQIDLRSLSEKHYELLIAKPELLKRTEIDGIAGYTAIANYADYASQLISLDAPPTMSNAYFRGKKLGLLDDPGSVSGYQVPKSALKRADIDLSLFEIIYYKSHLELYQALHSREVDLIASFRWLGLKDNGRDTPEKVLQLQNQLPGPRWYLHPGLLNSDAHCYVIAALQRVSLSNLASYLENITISRDCAHGI